MDLGWDREKLAPLNYNLRKWDLWIIDTYQVKSQSLPGVLTSEHIASPETRGCWDPPNRLTFRRSGGCAQIYTAGRFQASLYCRLPFFSRVPTLMHAPVPCGDVSPCQGFNLGCTCLKACDAFQEAQGHRNLMGTCTDLQSPSALCPSLASCMCPRDQQDLLPSLSHSGPSPLRWRRQQL